MRNRRGRGLPCDGWADTEPISTCPKPSVPSRAGARPFLSKPAANPSGLSKLRPPHSTRRRSSQKPNALRAARRTTSKRPASSQERRARVCARSGSRRNSRGRTTVSYTPSTLTQRGPPQRLVQRTLRTKGRAVERQLRRAEGLAGWWGTGRNGRAPLASLHPRQREVGPERALFGAIPASGLQRIRDGGLQGRRPALLIVELEGEQAWIARRQR